MGVYSCEKCGRNFISESAYTGHFASCMPHQSRKIMSCTECNTIKPVKTEASRARVACENCGEIQDFEV